MAKKTISLPDNDACPQLLALRERVNSEQRGLLDEFWQEVMVKNLWPLCRVVHSKRGKAKVRLLLGSLGGDVAYEREGQQEGSCYVLTLIGVLLTSQGEELAKMLIGCLRLMRSKFICEPERRFFTNKEVTSELGWSEEQSATMSWLCRLNLIPFGGGGSDGTWQIQAVDEVEDWENDTDLALIFDQMLFRFFSADKAVLADDRRKQEASQSSAIDFSSFTRNQFQKKISNTTPPTIDALKRRYQVFVSSTFEDLKEERQYVMQALLETKCIPTGMELFPATSAEQWDLIKRVIDECDYYIVIVAGRYGSISKSGVGYTEREFNYACQSDKPVIGFYHRDIDSLPGTKLEAKDSGRDHLRAFIEKVKQRVCRPYSTSSDLASAVKSAILNELEFTPRPGWVRADMVPTSDTVERLKQRIADLEEKLKKKEPETFKPKQDVEVLNVRYILSLDYRGDPDNAPENKTVEFNQEYTLGKILSFMLEGLRSGRIFFDLFSEFLTNSNDIVFLNAKPSVVKDWSLQSVDLDMDYFEKVLHTLAAKNLIIQDTNFTDDAWKITKQGYKMISEAKAIRQ